MVDRALKIIFLFFVLAALSGCADISINQNDITFEIKKGESIHEIAKRLKKESIIKNPLRFQILAKLMSHDRDFKFGIYLIRKGESYQDMIGKFSAGQTYSIRITIPEGYDIFQISDLLKEKGIVTNDDFLKECSNSYYISQYNLPGSKTLEGLLYPDTYMIPLGCKSDRIVQMMLDQFNKIIDRNIMESINKKSLTLRKVLIIASIVEKEARFEYEKPTIAGIYYNRIKKGMKLQADPTLIYALLVAGKYGGELHFSDFNIDSRYNTYKYFGLPPGPIANPDKTSIIAAIYPADTDYLYFVAKPDGTHYFSKTLEEHNKAVYQYQKLPAIERRKNRNP